MTMTVEERKVLTRWANKSVAVGAIHYPIAILCRVALKEDAIRTAQGMSAFGQDPKGLEAKPASPVAESDAP